MATVWLECQSLFSEKKKKQTKHLSSAEFAKRMVGSNLVFNLPLDPDTVQPNTPVRSLYQYIMILKTFDIDVYSQSDIPLSEYVILR